MVNINKMQIALLLLDDGNSECDAKNNMNKINVDNAPAATWSMHKPEKKKKSECNLLFYSLFTRLSNDGEDDFAT